MKPKKDGWRLPGAGAFFEKMAWHCRAELGSTRRNISQILHCSRCRNRRFDHEGMRGLAHRTGSVRVRKASDWRAGRSGGDFAAPAVEQNELDFARNGTPVDLDGALRRDNQDGAA